jgi:hypothetical protein
MANKKFSELDAAGALTGSEIFAVSQSSASKRSTLTAIKAFILANLTNVNNTSDANKPVSTAQAAADAAALAAANAYTDSLITGGASDVLIFKGVIDCSANPNYPAASAGHVYKVSVAGKIGGASGANVEVGDTLLCTVDGTAAGTQAAVGASWVIIQTNIDGAVIGPASAVSGHVATFSGTTGKLIQDSGLTLSGTNTGDQTTVSGNAGSATILQTARNINGVSFNGSANITVTADAGTLTGTTLASNVVTSSLTAVGTLTALLTADATLTPIAVNRAGVANTPRVQNAGTTPGTASSLLSYFSSSASNGAILAFAKSLHATVGSHTLVTSSTILGTLSFTGSDGVAFQEGCRIVGQIDGTPALNSMPSRIVFMTAPNASVTPVEVLRISSVGSLGFAGANYGNAGQQLISGGSTTTPAWSNPVLLQNNKSAAYTTVLADQGGHILHPSADTSARTFTIDSNANVAYPIGTELTFVNQNAAGVVTIAITSDTMRLAGAGTTGSRTLAANGIAKALKLTSTEWIISGTGLT